MRKRRLVTPIFVGMAILMCLWASGMLASDGNKPTGDASTAPAANAAQPGTQDSDQVTALKQQMTLQQKQIEQMQKALDEQKRLLEQITKSASAAQQVAVPTRPSTNAAKPASAAASEDESTKAAQTAVNPELATPPRAASLGQVASTTPMIPQAQKQVENAAIPVATGPTAAAGRPQKTESEAVSPLQLKIGSATITPVAFMDFTSVYRDHVTNGSIATNFSSVPYQSGAFGSNLSEFRLSTENSRIGLRVDADVRGAHVIGYMEADFHGNNATNVAETTNSNTLRERLYWVDLNTGKFEIMGGQTWTLLTPGRSGISPLPADIFYSQDIDVNYQLGLVFGRIPELRLVFHPSKQVAFAVALDSPDQYAGGNGGTGTITLPSALSAYSSELDYGGGNTLSTPNVAPDIIAKLAIDPNKHAHFEIGGIERTFKVWDAIASSSYATEGGGGFVNLNFELVKGFRIVTNNFWSDGGGRYIYGMAPDVVVRPDGSLSLVHSGSTVSGFEANVKNTALYAYYGGVYIARNSGFDANGKTPIGYGYSGASASTAQGQNRSLQEITFGFNQTLWKNAKYGALNFMGQYSWLTRNPWFVASGTQPDAALSMVFFNLRYSLPGSAPTMGKPY